MLTPYRSPHTPHGYFNELGSMHIHIDGAHDRTAIHTLLKKLEQLGHPGKFNEIIDWIAGPQRQQIPETYVSHTPGYKKEELNYFSTTLLSQNSQKRLDAINLLLKSLPSQPGIVAELEQIIGKIDHKNQKEYFVDAPLSLDLSQIDCTPAPSLPIEIHHAIDIPKQGTSPLRLSQLLQETTERGLCVGGWFVFEKADSWAYRSNAFVELEQAKEYAHHEHQELQNYLSSHIKNSNSYELRTLVERVWGIWRINPR